MKVINFLIALFAVFVLTSSYSDRQFGANPGQKVAPIELHNSAMTANLADMKGSYVLLSFWSSNDAVSRQLCKRYDTYQRHSTSTRHVSICLDSDKALFDAIVARDGLDPKTQFILGDKAAEKLRRDYHLDGTLGTLLIGPDGRVVAVNPSEIRLAQLARL